MGEGNPFFSRVVEKEGKDCGDSCSRLGGSFVYIASNDTRTSVESLCQQRGLGRGEKGPMPSSVAGLASGRQRYQ